jgi:hypothetical protein
MRAAVVEAFGPFDRIKVKEIEAPTPAQGEILIRVSVAGVNFADGGMVTGRAARKQPPFVPGVEAAGIVEAVGAGVSGLSVGDRVVYWDPIPRVAGRWRPGMARQPIHWRTRRRAVALMAGTTAHYLVRTLLSSDQATLPDPCGGRRRPAWHIAALRERAGAIVGANTKRYHRRSARPWCDRLRAASVRVPSDRRQMRCRIGGVGATPSSVAHRPERGTYVLYGLPRANVILDTNLASSGSIFLPGLAVYHVMGRKTGAG